MGLRSADPVHHNPEITPIGLLVAFEKQQRAFVVNGCRFPRRFLELLFELAKEGKKINVLEDCSAWDAYVMGHSASSIFHMSGWGRSVRKSMGHDLYYLYAEKEGNITGILPLIHIKSKIFGNSLVSVAFSVGGGPLFDDHETLSLLDQEAKSIADDLGVGMSTLNKWITAHPLPGSACLHA